MMYLLAVVVTATGAFYLVKAEPVVDRLRANGRLKERTSRRVQLVAWRAFGASGVLLGPVIAVLVAIGTISN